MVNGISGIIILPDDWQSISDISFNSGTGNYSQNNYSTEQWNKMESAGAIFIPAAGWRWGSEVNSVAADGDYWSVTPFDANGAYDFDFDSGNIYPLGYDDRYFGRTVRLVR